MASFDIAYNTYIKPNEGGYANITGDKGGETYAGIARNYFPAWPGWSFIDAYKKSNGAPKTNQMFKDLQPHVDAFYRDWWSSKRFGEINSQEVANLLFDYNVNSGTLAIKAIQRLAGVTADGAMGPLTIAAINKQNPAALHNALKEERRQLFERLAKQPGQSQFYTGWMNRLGRFKDMALPAMGILGLVITAVSIFFLLSLQDKPEKKTKKVVTA